MKKSEIILWCITIVALVLCVYFSTDIYRCWPSSLGDKILTGGDNPDFVDYYTGYFIETSICRTIFLTGIGIAFVIALIFYFGICNFVFKLAKLWTWLIVLVFVFGISFFTTIPLIVGNDADNPEEATGVFFNAYDIESEKLDGTDDDSMREEIQQTASDFREKFLAEEDSFMMRESLPLEMAFLNALYAVVSLIIFSFLFKRHTTHGEAIPF